MSNFYTSPRIAHEAFKRGLARERQEVMRTLPLSISTTVTTTTTVTSTKYIYEEDDCELEEENKPELIKIFTIYR